MTSRLRGRRFFVRTFGCQMNENDSEHIAGVLSRAGAVKAATAEEADVVIVNTCAVREKSEEKLRSYLGRLSNLKKKRPLLIGVAGCVAQVRGETLFKGRPFLDLVVGPDNYPDLPDLLEQAAADGPCVSTDRGRGWREIGPEDILREGATSGYVPIMEGCDNVCSYCVVPFSRGPEKFRPMADILREVHALAEAGFLEVQLLGQNVNSYRDPVTGRGFPALLDEVCAVPGPAWVRFLSSHPRNFADDIIEAMARNPKLCRQLHLPVQSGSTAVLEGMNRGYSREDYLSLADRLRTALPGIQLSTDIIVGFPGETETDFERTCDLLRQVRFANVFSFRYSPRPLTEASRRPDDATLAVKRGRLLRLQAIQKEIQAGLNRSFIGQDLRVLCLGPSPKGGGRISGRTEANMVVNFPAAPDVIGTFVNVRILGCGPYSLQGERSGG